MSSVVRNRFVHVDGLMIFSTLCLLFLGTVMIYSASSPIAAEAFGNHTHYLKKHALMLGLGVSAFVVGYLSPIQVLRKYSFPLLISTVVLLLFVEFSPFGVEAKNATRWLNIFGIRFQPSELVKPAIVIFVAAYIERMGYKIQLFWEGLLPILAMVGGVCVLLLKQPDFGTSVILLMTALTMLFVANARIGHMAILLGTASVLAYFLVMNVPYRRDRVLSFLNPWTDPQGKGFQIIQSFIAFKRGGIQGQGLGDGTQKLLYLPEAHTDFIFSVIAEELGFVGCLAVILLFAVLIFRGLALSIKIRDTFGSMLALGLTTILGLQAFLNMGVVMGLLPTKGLALPFLSYGGTALVVDLFCVGILISLSASVSSAERIAKRSA